MRLFVFFSQFLSIWKLRKPSLVSLYLQYETLYLVQLKKIKKVFLVEKMKSIPLPHFIFAEGKIKNWEVFSSILAKEVAELTIKKSNTIISIAANLAHIHHFKLPLGLTEQEIKLEIDKYFQKELLSLNDHLSIDFVMNPNAGSNTCTIYFVATRKDYIQQYVVSVETAGLRVKGVEDDLHSLIRVLNPHFSFSSGNDVFGFIYQTKSRIILILFNLFGILFHQEWRNANEPHWINGLKNNIELFLRDSASIRINQLFLSVLNFSTELNQMFTNEFGIEVNQFDPFSHINFSTNTDKVFLVENLAEFLIPLGAAMREVE